MHSNICVRDEMRTFVQLTILALKQTHFNAHTSTSYLAEIVVPLNETPFLAVLAKKPVAALDLFHAASRATLRRRVVGTGTVEPLGYFFGRSGPRGTVEARVKLSSGRVRRRSALVDIGRGRTTRAEIPMIFGRRGG